MSSSMLKKSFITSQPKVEVHAGKYPASSHLPVAGGHGHLRNHDRCGQPSSLLGQAELHPQIKILRAARSRRRSRHGLPLMEKILSDPKLEPVRKHADAEQGFRAGMGNKGITFLGERIS